NVAMVTGSWQGKKMDDVAAAWGPANSVQTLDDGRRVYGYSDTQGAAIAPYTCKVWFVVKDGVVQSSRTEESMMGSCSTILANKAKAN
ncbi:MAG TPA: hypothetical protein VN667_10045, partial [Burkholderiales bacterium]|nr:hypothetical protein [Burkholderiales bacterium]